MPNPYAGYDTMDNMSCRNTDTTSGHTCGSSPTGALMSYDNEGRLASWTAPSGTTATDGCLYDNEGCPGSCFLDMSGGLWQSGLDTAAGANVGFQVWHYDDWGNYHRIY